LGGRVRGLARRGRTRRSGGDLASQGRGEHAPVDRPVLSRLLEPVCADAAARRRGPLTASRPPRRIVESGMAGVGARLSGLWGSVTSSGAETGPLLTYVPRQEGHTR